VKTRYGFRSLSKHDPDYNNKNVIVPFSNWQGLVWLKAKYLYSISLKNNKYSTIFLVFLPAFFFALSLFVVFNMGNFFQRTTDPEYFHLLNGINIALFNLSTPYTAHPGTPLQVIVAVSSWPVSFFIPGSLVENVIDNPELFLKAALVLKSLIIALVLFFIGKQLFASTHNIWFAFLIQLTPFGNYNLITVFGRLSPESIMFVPILLLLIILIQYLYSDSQNSLSNKQLKYLAITGGLGMAIKFSFIPFLIIPVFLFKSFKQLFKYGIMSTMFTLLFAFPILFNFSKSMSWFGNMLVKSGQWGGGESTFIDWAQVPDRFFKLMKMNYLFPGLVLVLIALFVYVHFFIKNKKHDLKVLNLITAGLVSGIIVSVFVITKHFAYRYFIPTMMCETMLVYLIVEYARRIFRFKTRNDTLAGLAFAIYFIILIWHIPVFSKTLERTKNSHTHYEERSEIVKNSMSENLPVIISSYYAGSPFPEFSLNDAYLLCGNLKSTFSDKLRAKYPQSNFYVGWSPKFYHWNYFRDAGDFIVPEAGVYVFIGQEKEEDLEDILMRLKRDFPAFKPHLELLQHFQQPEEYFYKISFTQKS